MPARPAARTQSAPEGRLATTNRLGEDDSPYRRIAADLRGAIGSGVLKPGDHLPTEKAFADRYGVAVGTAHRVVSELVGDGLAKAARGRRAVVA